MKEQYVSMVLFEGRLPILTRASATWLPSFLYPLLDWVRDQIDAIVPYRKETYLKVDVNLENIIKLVFNFKHQIYRFNNREPREIFIGNDEWRKLSYQSQDLMPWQYLEINTDKTILAGIKLTIVPWMKGILIV